MQTEKKMSWPIRMKFGEVTCSEAEVTLNASAESGTNPVAAAILKRYYELGGCTRREFELTREQAFEQAAEKLDRILKQSQPIP